MRSVTNSKGFTTFLNRQESKLFERLEEFGPPKKRIGRKRAISFGFQMRQRDVVKLVKLKDGTNAYKHIRQKSQDSTFN